MTDGYGSLYSLFLIPKPASQGAPFPAASYVPRGIVRTIIVLGGIRGRSSLRIAHGDVMGTPDKAACEAHKVGHLMKQKSGISDVLWKCRCSQLA